MIFICDLIYFTTALLFGTAISFFLAGISVRKNNIICLLLFCSFEGLLQGIALYLYGTAATKQLYPLLTHLPLIVLLVILYKKSLLTAIVSVFSAYLCCQIPWWCAFFIDIFFSNKIIYTIVYVLSAITVLLIIYKYASDTICLLLTISNKNVLLTGAVPFLYYVFDYTSTVYTNWLYLGNIAIVQFMPFVTACFYLIFIIIYYKEFSSKEEAKHQANILELQLQHASASLEQMRRLQENTITYRHDMRHHLSYIQALISSGSYEKIGAYITSIQSDIDDITPTKYCQNELINLILSTYVIKAGNQYTLDIQANVPDNITVSDTHLCVLLSNALENALNSTANTNDKSIHIRLTTRASSLMLQISNPFCGDLIWKNGLPLSPNTNHGYGVRSIAAIVDSYNGQYEFSADNHIFTLRILLPL